MATVYKILYIEFFANDFCIIIYLSFSFLCLYLPCISKADVLFLSVFSNRCIPTSLIINTYSSISQLEHAQLSFVCLLFFPSQLAKTLTHKSSESPYTRSPDQNVCQYSSSEFISALSTHPYNPCTSYNSRALLQLNHRVLLYAPVGCTEYISLNSAQLTTPCWW